MEKRSSLLEGSELHDTLRQSFASQVYFKESKLPTPVAELSYVQEEDESTEDKLRRLEDTGCGEEEGARKRANERGRSCNAGVQERAAEPREKPIFTDYARQTRVLAGIFIGPDAQSSPDSQPAVE